MCLAIPTKILSIRGDNATIELGGMQREVSLMLLEDASVGDWVIIHAGFAIQKVDEEEAKETLQLWNEFLDSSEEA